MEFDIQNGMIPVNIREEMAEGRTKIVLIGKARTKFEAIQEIKNAKRQLEGLK